MKITKYNKMKVGVLGGTGRTGQPLIMLALDEGHEVVTVVRSAKNLLIKHKRLTVIEDSNIFSKKVLKEHFHDVDAIFSCLGFPLGIQPVKGYTLVTQAVVEALRELPCKRLIILHSWHSHPQAREHPSWSTRRLKFLAIIAPVLNNLYEAEQYLRNECQDIDWTVVSPPGLCQEPPTYLPIEVVDDEYYILGVAPVMPRTDVARHMLNIVKDIPTFRKVQAIGIAPPEPDELIEDVVLT